MILSGWIMMSGQKKNPKTEPEMCSTCQNIAKNGKLEVIETEETPASYSIVRVNG